MDFTKEAFEKIAKEYEEIKGGDRYVTAVKDAVKSTMNLFIGQDGEFAQAVAQTERKLEDIIKAATKGCGGSSSDIDVYQKVVSEYFPGAKVNFNMRIDLCGGVNAEEPKIIDLDLTKLVFGGDDSD